MRRHAKASTAGSTQRQANGLGRFFRGADAVRGISGEDKGSGAPAARRLFVPVSVFAAILALMVVAIPASATKTHLFKETFGSAAQPSFGDPRGIAIDQSSGDVLVMDAGSPPSIKRFNPDGSADDFAALGTNVIDGAGSGDETPQGGLGFANPVESQIAVDNSGGATDGNIYVTQSSPNAINVFSKEGNYLGQLTESSGGPFSEACGVAVDPAGAVYVGDYSGGIHKFVPAANPPVNADNTATFSSVTEPCTLAAGAGASAGFLFAAQYAGPISKLDSASGELKYVVAGGSTTTLSVDPGTGHVFAASGSTIEEFDASAAGSATNVSGFSLAGEAFGLAVRGSSGEIHVSQGGNANVEVFGALVALPDVTTGAASPIGQTTATLNGTVNPDGVELSECSFEYGKTTSYGQSAPCAQSPATIGASTSEVPVSADISGLELSAEYHFRLVAKNPNGTVKGTDSAFKLESPPVIKGAWSEDVVRKEATLKARINPEGSTTTYKFEWGTTASYGNVVQGDAGSDKADHLVATFLEGLQPGTTYHYRVLATNSIGTTATPDLTFITYAPPAPQADCPNQPFRYGPGVNLPDCRAYEMVSPVDKAGGDIRTSEGYGFGSTFFRTEINQASLAGDKFTFSSYKAFAGALSNPYSTQYLATRGPGGWSTEAISPRRRANPLVITVSTLGIETAYRGFNEDLSRGWVIGTDPQPLTPDAARGILTEGIPNIYERDNLSGGLRALTIGEPLVPEEDKVTEANKQLESAGESADGSTAVFSIEAALTPDAALHNNSQVYARSDGQLELISVLPGGEANPEDSSVGSGVARAAHGGMQLENAISEDGSRIFWSSSSPPFGSSNPQPGTEGKVYVRIDGESTVAVSAGDEAWFWTATPDGSEAIYGERIGFEEDLYRFDVDTETRTPIAGEVRGVLGASDDLSHLYYISKEDLAPGAVAGELNLYLDREGAVTLVATLANADAFSLDSYHPNPGTRLPIGRNGRVSPDGRHIAFMSSASLTGYDNTDALGASADSANGDADFEVFTYDADSNERSCVSCNPSAARPRGKALVLPYNVGDQSEYSSAAENEYWAAAWLPTWENSLHASRTLSEDGDRVFFNSFDPLVPEDTNGVQDVYQWEAPGSGSCVVGGHGYSPLNDGCISLISTGQSPVDSEFMDATPSGDRVFIRTDESIYPEDPFGLDIYAAAVDGGYPPPPPPPTPCVGDACQNIPAAPNDPTPASASFRGAGNVTPAKPRRRCRARARHGKAGKQQARQKRAKQRCKRSNRRASR